MSHTFYTSVHVYGSKILYRGIENGRRVRRPIEYFPTLYIPSSQPTEFTTIHGDYVAETKPGSIRDCREFVDKYDDVENFKIFGNQKYEYTFISDNFPDEIDWDVNLVNVCNIDIEVGSENGFPEPATASEPITAITFKTAKKFVVLGCGDFNNSRDDVRYVRCSDEIDLIKRFVDEWTGDYPDIITGWNVKFFDIPYLVNRITKLMGEEFVRRLSPWNRLSERTVVIMGRPQTTYLPLGISMLDYIELYKKFAPGGMSQESYKLDAICNVELNERKLSYEEYGSLHTLYKDNYQLFIEYNIRDVELVDKLDDKLKLIELALTLAYDSKSNYDDVFQQTRMWDSIIYNHLKKKNIVIPPIQKHKKDAAYIGAYVKDPQVGMHKWVASLDLNSLYPHLIMQFNISPEMLVEPHQYTDTMKSIILSSSNEVDDLLMGRIDTSRLINESVTLTPNGQFFRINKQGFLAEIMESMYNDRTVYKKKSIEAKKDLEKETDPLKRIEIEKRIARYNNLQLAKKVSLNSAYGALGNEYFRFFDVRQATAITTSGQLAIRWIEKKLNEYLNKLLNTEKDYVIASDTDSIYLSLDELVCQTFGKEITDTKKIIKFMDKVCESKIQPFIDKSYRDLATYVNAYDQKMQMKREALADKGIWTAKKRYILNVYNNEGVEYAKPKVKIMGLEVKKSSTPALFRDKMEECIHIMLNSTQDKLIDYIDEVKKEMKIVSIADISFPRGVNGLEKFSDVKMVYGKGCPIHVRGSLLYNNLISKHKLDKKYPLIKEGEKIKFIYLKEPNTIRSNVIAFIQTLPKEFDLESYIDYDLQFTKAFLEPIKIITDSIGWKTEITSSLEDFFLK